MSTAIVLDYPHILSSMEPRRMRADAVWRIGEAARRQICVPAQRPKVDIARLIARTRHLRVNGLAFETQWELGGAIADDFGNPVLGATEYDENWPVAALIYLNGELIGERDDLARSTAAHELGHAVFDAPSWIQRARESAFGPGSTSERRFQSVSPDESKSTPGIDWREWRANEFMGAFLAPRRLLHLHMHKRAAALCIPMMTGENDDALPIVNGPMVGFDRLEALALELAEVFGVSIPFMDVRLRKYGLIASL